MYQADDIKRVYADFDMKTYMARQDIIWDNVVFHEGSIDESSDPRTVRIPKNWGESGLIGNGMIGAAIYKKDKQTMMWELGRNDAEAKFKIPDVDTCTPRSAIGAFDLAPGSNVISESMRIGLYDAEVSGEIQTTDGRIIWRSMAHATENTIAVEIKTEGNERSCKFDFRPYHGMSLKAWATPDMAVPDKYVPPAPYTLIHDGVTVTVREYITEDGVPEGELAVAYIEKRISDNHRIYYISIEYTPNSHKARESACKLAQAAESKDFGEYIRSHRLWWHDYYRQSIIEIPDAHWESFYLMQMYKLACCARKEFNCVIDNQGIWAAVSRWPGTWWNLNVQLSYSPLYKANRLELSETLINALEEKEDVLTQNAYPIGIKDGLYIKRSTGRDMECPMPSFDEIMNQDKEELLCFELGNLTWALHSVYRQYRCTMDDSFLRDRLYPLLKKAINVFLRLSFKREDGKWHLPKTTSPEYPGDKSGTSCPAYDTNYDLALFKWGLKTLLWASERLKLNDPLEPIWKEHIENLIDFPCGENGYLIAENLPYAMSHRHYSHLLHFFPLHILSEYDQNERAAVEKTIVHWMSLPEKLKGYSYTGSSCMASTLEDGNRALQYLNGLRDFALPNTLYTEGGGPVIETPLASAESIHYMLLQCHNDLIKIFPAMPDAWPTARYHQLLAEGAFTVSAEWADGRTQYVLIKSNAGHPLRIKPNIGSDIEVTGEREFNVEYLGDGQYAIDVKKGEEILIQKK